MRLLSYMTSQLISHWLTCMCTRIPPQFEFESLIIFSSKLNIYGPYNLKRERASPLKGCIHTLSIVMLQVFQELLENSWLHSFIAHLHSHSIQTSCIQFSFLFQIVLITQLNQEGCNNFILLYFVALCISSSLSLILALHFI